MSSRNGYVPKPKTRDDYINDKIKVLKELCVVDKHNEDEIRKALVIAVSKEPDTDIDIVLDRVAKMMIREYYDK